MPYCTVTFRPYNKSIKVERGETLLKAASKAHITLNNLCGGDGICGRCKMMVRKGEVSGEVSAKLTREEIRNGYVLACMTYIQSNLEVEIPEITRAREKIISEEDAERFRDFDRLLPSVKEYVPAPLVTKVYLELDKPTLLNNAADHQRVCEAIRKKLDVSSMQLGLKIMKTLPAILREADFKVTATVGLRREIAEVMDVVGGDTSGRNYMVVIDIGTTTIVAHLVDANRAETVDAKACYNSQGIYGREVTARIMAAERKGVDELQKILVEDINQLIGGLASNCKISLKDITAVVCAGNTAIGHFLLGLPSHNIRRSPYVPTSVEPPPLRAVEVGIQISPRGLLYSLPGISGWVGSDLTAGILATNMHKKSEVCLLMDIGTNGEIIVGNKDWLVACSASAGPALEGASEECGMRAERGAIERVWMENNKVLYKTIGNGEPIGICGSGIIDLVSTLFEEGIIDRSGKYLRDYEYLTPEANSIKKYILVDKDERNGKKSIYFSESDIEHVINAKAAIYAAMKIILSRLDLSFHDIEHFYIAGAFGNFLNIENAITIGLIPDIPRERIEFVGNTSIKGAKLAALYQEAFQELGEIRSTTTYYDLMGAEDYIEEFKKALFLPHTDIELFPTMKRGR
ncbi:MAG: ASKHA domain-containing protein [Spirochaetota bacterium]